MASSARIDELRKKFDENPRRYFAPLANEYRKVGDLEQAIFICQEYLPQQPGHMSGHIVYGQALFEAGRHDEARAVFETALSLDPENLIALRHLGDIARAGGDATAARSWYQRVLEADPRNEEIGSVLKELGGEAPSVEARESVPGAEESIEPWARAEAAQSEAPGVGADVDRPSEPVMEIEQTPDSTAWGMIEPTAPPAEEPVIEVPSSAREPVPAEMPQPPATQGAANAADELLDIGDFDLGGASAPPSEQAAPGTGAESAHGGEAAPELAETEDESLAFEADPYAIASRPAEEDRAESHDEPAAAPAAAEMPQGPLDEALDFELPHADQPPAPEPSAPATLEGLQAFDGSVSRPAAEPPAAPPMEGLYVEEPPASVSELAPAADSVPIDGGHDGSEPSTASEHMRPTPSAPAEMFVTETMAQLYLQQGHLEAAVDTYRRLVANRPDDAGLRARMEEAERRLQGPAPTAAAPAGEPSVTTPEETATIEEPAVAPAAAGPTIREFLAGLFGGTAASIDAGQLAEATADRPESTNGGAPSNGNAIGASVGAPARAPEVAAAPSSSVSGSVDALFSGLQPSASDENAAFALAQAFAPPPQESLPLKGMPARRASDELSLGHVFKSKTPARGTASDFSFDQFFADEMHQEPASAAENPAPAPSGDDVAQFSAWLNGLKKT